MGRFRSILRESNHWILDWVFERFSRFCDFQIWLFRLIYNLFQHDSGLWEAVLAEIWYVFIGLATNNKKISERFLGLLHPSRFIHSLRYNNIIGKSVHSQDRKTNSFVRFLGESAAQQFCFEIYWPDSSINVFKIVSR